MKLLNGAPKGVNRIELDLRDIHQLFNSMDPSPFHEKDLDADAEEFIVSWAQEFPLPAPVALAVHLREPLGPGTSQAAIEQAVRHYFTYRADLNRLELKRLLDQGRASLAIGLLFLTACLLGVGLLRPQSGAATGVLRESLTIAGWVAMWRPMQIYLYDWWPLARRGRIFEKMSRMKVEIIPHRPEKAPAIPA